MDKKQKGNKNVIVDSDPGVSNAYFGGDIGHESWAMIEGYGSAALYLASHAHEENERDTWLYPSLYLFRHYVELSLKDIYLKWKDVDGEEVDPRILEGHGLDTHLYVDLWKWISAQWPTSDRESLKEVRRTIVDLHRLDKSGQAFRYIKSTEGKFFRTDTTKLIGYTSLSRKIETVKSFLDGIQAWIDNELETRAEQYAEFSVEWD
ncbi:hypothetical protein [Alicyclobacillus sp. SO9]|uniref:hypothetical protein n=1 Tax=Alicyclobacillus sp. SO9 TaxID=2665646 RepID=UPI0018E78472|nr:hypothetical protein [Alicyclobacillus sp. SO9]QQE77279.1 hypothetical protein GI364_15070 [Alicyclobacillus sp. SO9]